jgi:DNA-directed RNA polymerase I subunit RPA1
MGLWIQLQDAVNCYMDSAKDPNLNAALKGQVPGIRQVLERKEGMFRMNMMGKRVNFCCRSVISPDPYIGTNEIGIPKHFAMGLHYPEPVNAHNARHLRTLVERGADEYPGQSLLFSSLSLILFISFPSFDRAAARVSSMMKNSILF